MSTGCACVYVDYEPIEEISRSAPVARKEHKCGECRGAIQKGEPYEKVVGTFDGRLETYKTCRDCLSVRNAFFCSSWGYTRVWEDLGEHLSEVCWGGRAPSSKCITPLTPLARDKVCDMIEEMWEDQDDDEDE